MLRTRPDAQWQDEAACRNTDPAVFFDAERWHTARAICAGCPVREACLEYALTQRIKSGIWAGLSPQQRDHHRKHKPGCTCLAEQEAP